MTNPKDEKRLPFPTTWDKAFSTNNRGQSLVVVKGDGKPKKPLFVKKNGPRGGGSSLFAINQGDVLIDVKREHKRYDIKLKGVRDVTMHNGEYVVDWYTVARTYQGCFSEADNNIVDVYSASINQAIEKAS